MSVGEYSPVCWQIVGGFHLLADSCPSARLCFVVPDAPAGGTAFEFRYNNSMILVVQNNRFVYYDSTYLAVVASRPKYFFYCCALKENGRISFRFCRFGVVGYGIEY